MDTRPIGVFDSGSGGLSVWQSISRMLPCESTVYIGDHRYLPYSTKSIPDITGRGKKCIQFLLTKHVKLIVIACNTATVAAIDSFRRFFPNIPIVGVVPVVKTASEVSKKKTFAVLSTEFTSKSPYQQTLIHTFAPDCTVYSVGDTKLVKAIENGKKDETQVKTLLHTYLDPLIVKGIDVLVLGCTHFPFLKNTIEDIVGSHVLVLDSGNAVSRHVKHILDHEGISSLHTHPTYEFFTTGDGKKATDIMSNLLGRGIVVKTAPLSVQ